MPVGDYVGYFLDQARSTGCMPQGCRYWASGPERLRKTSQASHNRPASKWGSSMASASVPSSMFLTRLPSVMECEPGAVSQTNPFFPRLPIVVTFYHKSETLTEKIDT